MEPPSDPQPAVPVPLEASPVPAPTNDAASKPVLAYASPDLARVVNIARFPNPFEANLAAAKLESFGIRTQTSAGSHLYIQFPGSVVTILSVFSSEAETAREILRATPARRCLLDDDGLPIIPVREAPTCPMCKSDRVTRRTPWSQLLIGEAVCVICAIAFSIGVAILLGLGWLIWCVYDRPLHCAACGHIWPAPAEEDNDDDDEEENDRGADETEA